MTALPYVVRFPGQSERTVMIPDPWEGPLTKSAPNVVVVFAPLLINSSSGAIRHAWAGWRLDGDVLSKAPTELWGQP